MYFLNNYVPYAHAAYSTVKRIRNYIYAVGSTSDLVDGNPVRFYCFITKTDLSGNLIYQKKYDFGTDVSFSGQSFRDIAEGSDGGVILIGIKDLNPGLNSIVMFLDDFGQIVWSKIIAGNHYINSVIRTGENQFIASFNFQGIPLLLCKFTVNGDLEFYEVNLPGPPDFNNILVNILKKGNNFFYTFSGHVLEIEPATMQIVNQFYILGPDDNFTRFYASTDTDLFMFGRDGDDGFGVKIPINTIPAYPDSKVYSAFSFPHNEISYPAVNSGYLYSGYQKFTHDFDFILAKEIEAVEGSELMSVTDTETLFAGIEGDVYIGKLDLDFNSCASSDVSMSFTKVQTTVTMNSDFDPSIESVSIETSYYFPVVSLLPARFSKICEFLETLDLLDTASIQSPNFYLQAVGSTGDDSARGIHLRWAFRGLLEQHLPKGNYTFATYDYSFNKPQDFVKIFRATYVPHKVSVGFDTYPIQVNEGTNQKSWIYQVGQRAFYIYFRDYIKYNQARVSFDPMTDPLDFIAAYGDGLIEIEHKTDLSFTVSIHLDDNSSSYTQVELLSVTENKITAPKAVSLRKTYNNNDINEKPLVAENIRSVRLRTYNGGFITGFAFEFYSDFINITSADNGWEYMDAHALTKDDDEAYSRLEPQHHCLDSWLRYNDQAYVNPENYRERWNSPDLDVLQTIANSVGQYILLSDDPDNPKANAIFPFEDNSAAEACSLQNPDYDPYIPEGTDASNNIQLSYLDILLLGSLDYHNARMLGMGTLDLGETVMDDDKFIYVAQYFTFADLQDNLGPREVQHIYCSLPTSLSDQRLPIPVDLQVPVPGIFFDNGYDGTEVDEDSDESDLPQEDTSSVELTADGYSPDGKTRYYTFYCEPIEDEQDFNAPFFVSTDEFIACETTFPVFAGMEYRPTGETDWIKPELSYDTDYYNIDTSGVPHKQQNETIAIMIPDNGKSLYSYGVKQSGSLDFSSYGINWFSRAKASEVVHMVETLLKPANTLLPPANINAQLIQKERPLMFTTAFEQGLYDDNTGNDKTLVRLIFDYNHAQELINYHQQINGETVEYYYELPDDQELFADSIEIFYREQPPKSVFGKVKQVIQTTNPLVVKITTETYAVLSSGINENIFPQTDPPTYNEMYVPYIESGHDTNFVGSILLADGVEYVVQQVDNSGEFPIFALFRTDGNGVPLTLQAAANPGTQILEPQEGSLFIVVENMQNEISWNMPDVTPFTVNIDLVNVYREEDIIIQNQDCNTETHVQKFRGIYEIAQVEKILERVDENEDGSYDIIPDGDEDPDNDEYVYKHMGLYKLTFPPEFILPQHSQYNEAHTPGTQSVEWYKGVARIHTLSTLGITQRKDFEVIRTENIGATNLILYVRDPSFPTDDAQLPGYAGKIMPDDIDSVLKSINYYPGYKVYLYKDDGMWLNQESVLFGLQPNGDKEINYNIFGLRSKDLANETEYDNTVDFFSKWSVPVLMPVLAILEPLRPQRPTGGTYATRPDYFGKASYTLMTKYGLPGEIHKPYAVQFNRASDIQFLAAIYDNSVPDTEGILNTVQNVMQNIFMDGEEAFFVDRWMNLLGFDYTYPDNPLDDGLFALYEDRRLPMPDKPAFIDGINAFIDAHNREYSETLPHLASDFKLTTVVIPDNPSVYSELLVKDFLREAIYTCFVPLTEIPVVYNYVNGNDYVPIPKKQVIRDRNGNLLKPTDPDFDMAPMMKRVDPDGAPYESQFTDFGLDGASNCKYFYAVREINNQLATSDYSEILGPISMVNTAPPTAPQVVKVVPVLENRTTGMLPAIQMKINAYSTRQHIAKISLYRTFSPANALSVRTMDLIKVIDIEEVGMESDNVWIVGDDFADLPDVPFSDPLFYKITVSRKIRYADKDGEEIIDYAPSEMSKIMVANIVENYNPESPAIDYFSDPLNEDNELTAVILHWQKQCYNARYHLYKMNSQGNWVKIYELQTNDADIYVYLGDTSLESGTLQVANGDGSAIYHHFKVITENTAGMMSKEEKILTIYDPETWQDAGGIGAMITEGTFIVR